ncbi:unnamed protein product [Owenia fusiformis]|uniref:E3 ubiquitin-protein ligase CHFR n=1 Tax=Owenia fusiformis TaxID=6347 RepID=A0A8S4Q9G7_OWEFU|nr:unnamed protein product [Owenia fusiformis]
MEGGEKWAQLVCTTDLDSEPIFIDKNSFCIGRAKGCDISLASNKMVSGKHCAIYRDKNGIVSLKDTSTNGTLLNMKERICKRSHLLEHGDEIHIVFRRDSPETNVAYIFQDLVKLEQEMQDATQEYSSDAEIDGTLEYTDPVEFTEDPPSKKQKLDNTKQQNKIGESTKQTLEKVKNQSSEAENCTNKDIDTIKTTGIKQDVSIQKSTDTNMKELEKGKENAKNKNVDAEISKKAEGAKPDAIEETLLCIICQEIMHDCISLQPCMHSFCAGCYSDWMERSNECPSCRLKVDRINKNHIVNNLVDAYLGEHPDRKRPEEDIKELDAKNKITKDMLYPKKKRNRDDSESDEYSDDNDDDDENSDDNNDGVVAFGRGFAPPPFPPGLGGFGLGLPQVFTPAQPFQHYQPPKTVCRQCKEYTGPHKAGATNNIDPSPSEPSSSINQPGTLNTNTGATNSKSGVADSTSGVTHSKSGATGEGSSREAGACNTEPSTSADPGQSTSGTQNKVREYPDFVCPKNQDHCLCQCCLQPFPDRRNERARNPDAVPLTQCPLCWKIYCHNYWGCKRAGCRGCMARFKDFDFGENDMNTILLQNTYESTILKDYLKEKKLTIKQVLDECCTKLDSKAWASTDFPLKLKDSNAVLCYGCALKNFKDLVYNYRKNIPNGELPATVTARADCHWGKSCRTQRHKPHHAANLNHICEQTRF